MHVLLVEPDTILADAYAQKLQLSGCSVAIARTAQTAVHAADMKRPDIVLLELELSLHNGIEFLYEFRSYAEWFNIPVIINSFVPPEDYVGARTLSKELGVVRTLRKSQTTISDVCEAVRSCSLAAAK